MKKKNNTTMITTTILKVIMPQHSTLMKHL